MLNHLTCQIKNFRHSIIISPFDGSHRAYLTALIYKNLGISVVAVLPDQSRALNFLEDLKFFLPEDRDRIIFFPGYRIMPLKSLASHRETCTERLCSLSRMTDNNFLPAIVVTSVDAVIQKLVPRKAFDEFSELVMPNEELDRDALIAKLETGGYMRTSLVEDPGDYAVRGSIIDIYSSQYTEPLRMEFFGDLVESVRHFSPYTQRGTEELAEAVVIPASEAVIPEKELPHILARLRQAGAEAGLDATGIRQIVNQVRESGRFAGIETMLSIVYEKLDTFFDYIPEESLILTDAPEDLESRAMDIESRARINYKNAASEKRLCVNPDTVYLGWDRVREQICIKKNVSFQMYDMAGKSNDPCGRPELVARLNCQDNGELSASLKREGSRDNPLEPLAIWLNDHLENRRTVLCVLSQESQAKRLLSLLGTYGIEPVHCNSFPLACKKNPGIYYLYGNISSGFVMDEDALAIVTENEIFGKKRIRRRKAGQVSLKTSFIAPEELKEGDIVVHVEHGVGRFQGLCRLQVGGIVQDFILILYQDDDKLYLPVDRIEMIGKYIGVDGYTPVLDKIGSRSWIKSKEKAKKEVEKLAADLLDLYAKRKVRKGFSFSRPDNYYNEFEASFPYEETRDQLRAIDDVLADMESEIPMDRLVCGDVGYGKTEVAVRAAFKAVNDGKQVAVVVPTTILAEQHLATFRTRFSDYPVNIECLSRFRTRREQTRILKAISSGTADIVIGTHRLLQKDVDFKSLGLLVIDEEQRFGVRHKEALKRKRSTVDVLALTATPIPRTLHLSLTGMRDISVISTPPVDRQPIISCISKYDEAIVKDAVKRELGRRGQVFFVHNNISTIFKTAENLEKLVPEARIGVAHGRLSEKDLEDVMLKFVNMEIDILVCTTIIESGLDIPSANTMIIDRAERFGLSQIYQLRGRIGRKNQQAYAYLFVSDENRMSKDARKRLSALMEYRDLGSGFQIAMKDLQIRGAGTALGASQSGHIAAVGYDMFLKLLSRAVRDMKGEEVTEPLEPEINVSMSSGFPQDYIESMEQRLTLYRRLSRITKVSDISDMKKELVDRYGKLPQEAENMLLKIMLRVYAIRAGVKKLDVTPNTLTLGFSHQHMKKSFDELVQFLRTKVTFDLLKKDSIRIRLGRKRNKISKALLETRNILKMIA